MRIQQPVIVPMLGHPPTPSHIRMPDHVPPIPGRHVPVPMPGHR